MAKVCSVGGRSDGEGRRHMWVLGSTLQFPVLSAGTGQLGSGAGVSRSVAVRAKEEQRGCRTQPCSMPNQSLVLCLGPCGFRAAGRDMGHCIFCVSFLSRCSV